MLHNPDVFVPLNQATCSSRKAPSPAPLTPKPEVGVTWAQKSRLSATDDLSPSTVGCAPKAKVQQLVAVMGFRGYNVSFEPLFVPQPEKRSGRRNAVESTVVHIRGRCSAKSAHSGRDPAPDVPQRPSIGRREFRVVGARGEGTKKAFQRKAGALRRGGHRGQSPLMGTKKSRRHLKPPSREGGWGMGNCR